MATMDYAEIRVEQKYHRHIIGKGGASGEWSIVVFNTKYSLCLRQ